MKYFVPEGNSVITRVKVPMTSGKKEDCISYVYVPSTTVPCTTQTITWSSTGNNYWHAYYEDYIPKEIIFQKDKKMTILVWKDDSRTIVRCSENEEFVEEFGVAMATMKKIYGDRGTFLRHMEEVGKEQKQYVKKSKKNDE